MVRVVFVVLGMLGAAVAQYTGPMFDPGNAPFFGPSGLVDPTLSDIVPTTIATPTFVSSRMSSASGSVITSGVSSRPMQTTISRNASQSSSRNATMSSTAMSSSASQSSSFSTSTSASRTSSSASAPAQSTGAAVTNIPGVMGSIVGGMFAGLAML